ncbi:MAG: SHOCT domain-containing protein [Smithella sp.]|jgi:putative membrane protein
MKHFFYMAAASIIALLMTGCNGYYGPLGGGWNHMMNYGYGYGFGGMYMVIIFIIIIGVVAYFVIQSARARTLGGTPQETPLDILKKRYAKGEISKDDFDRMKRDLET